MLVAKGNKTVQFDTIHKQFSDKHYKNQWQDVVRRHLCHY